MIKQAMVVAAVAVLAGCSGGAAGVSTGTSTGPGATSGVAGSSAPADSAAGGAGGGAVGSTTAFADLGRRTTAAQKKAGTAHVALSNTGGANGGMTGTGLVDFRAAKPSMKLDLTTSGGESRKIGMVVVPGALYMSTGEAVGGAQWLKLSHGKGALGAMYDTFDKMIGDLGGLSAYDNAGMTGVAAKVTKVDQVDGHTLTTYAVHLTGDQIGRLLPANYPSRAAMVKQMKPAVEDLTMVVDERDLVQRITTVVKLSGRTTTVDNRYSKWGEPVTIAAPSAADVADGSVLDSLGR